MRILITIIFISITGLGLIAQSETQTLFDTWNDVTQTDSVRTIALKNLINSNYLYTNSDSAILLAREMELFGKKQPYAMAEALGYHMQGLSWHVKGNYPEALKFYHQGLILWEANNDNEGISKVLNNIGVIYSNQGAYAKALEYYRKSLVLKEGLGSQKGIANSLNSIGNIYAYQGDYPSALEYFTRSLAIAEALEDKLLVAGFLNNLGYIYERQGNAEKALEYFTQSLALNEDIDSKSGIALSLGNVGNALVTLEQYDKALDAFSKSLAINEAFGYQRNVANMYNNIGTIYQIKKDNRKALTYCAKGYTLATSLNLLKNMKDGCACLYEVHKTLGNGFKALEYHEALKRIDDSLAIEETAKSLQQMEFQNEMLKDSIEQAEESRAIELEHERELQNREQMVKYTVASGSVLLLIAIGLFTRVRYIRRAKSILQTEKDRSEHLLLNILPYEIAEELKAKGEAEARTFDNVTILFSDFKDFTQASEKLSAADLVAEINTCFKAFDQIMDKYSIEKIKTIGDAYMAVGGLPVPSADSAKKTVLAALEMQSLIIERKAQNEAVNKPAFEMRAGIHTGSVVAGIVGAKKFQYDIWGDTVNTASRMETSGEVGQVNISEVTYELIKNHSEFTFTSRGKVEVKGKGKVAMWFVTNNKQPDE